MSELLAFLVEQNAQCVAGCQEPGSITESQQNCCLKYDRGAPVRNKSLQRVQNFEDQESVENRDWSGRPEISNWHEQREYINDEHETQGSHYLWQNGNLLTYEVEYKEFYENRLQLFLDKTENMKQLEDRDYESRT